MHTIAELKTKAIEADIHRVEELIMEAMKQDAYEIMLSGEEQPCSRTLQELEFVGFTVERINADSSLGGTVRISWPEPECTSGE